MTSSATRTSAAPTITSNRNSRLRTTATRMVAWLRLRWIKGSITAGGERGGQEDDRETRNDDDDLAVELFLLL